MSLNLKLLNGEESEKGKSMKRTYIDSGVLIAAIRGIEPIAQKALEILDDPDREFVSSMFVKLEVLPKAAYHKQTLEQEFYTTFFDSVTCDSLGKELPAHYPNRLSGSL